MYFTGWGTHGHAQVWYTRTRQFITAIGIPTTMWHRNEPNLHQDLCHSVSCFINTVYLVIIIPIPELLTRS